MQAVAKGSGSASGARLAARCIAVVLAALAGGGCRAEEPAGDILRLALSPFPSSLSSTPQRRLPFSASLTAPVAGTSFSTLPNADVGVSWHPALASRQLDITAWRRMGPPADALSLIQDRDPTFGARVEFKLAQPRRGFAADLRFIGMQLDNGARIGVRKANGNPTLYYRQQF